MCASRLRCSGDAAGRASRGPRARRARRARRSRRPRPRVSAAPLPLGGERHLGPDPLPGRRIASPRSPRGSGCARRSWRRSAPAPAGPRSPRTGRPRRPRPARARRWSASRSCRRRSCRPRRGPRCALICWTSVSSLARRTAATASVTLISRTRPSGISVIRPAVAVCAASCSGVLPRLQGEDQHDGERDHQPGARLQHQVHLVLERGGRVAEGARLAGHLLGVAVLAHGVDLVVAGARDAERTGERPLADPLADAVGLAGEHRLVEGEPAALGDLAVGDELVAGLDPDHSRRGRPRRPAARPARRRGPPSPSGPPAAPGCRASPWPSAPGGSRCSC